MTALHPWLRGLAIGACAGLLASPMGFRDALGAAVLAGAFCSMKFSRDQQAFEQRLLNQERNYPIDVEQAFARIQRAMANVWINDSYWQLVTADLATGYMLYRYEWREEDSPLHDGRIRHHASLEIECVGDADNMHTTVALKFDGFPNWMNKTIFYQTVSTAVENLDYFVQ
jgi:hypothetical protein